MQWLIFPELDTDIFSVALKYFAEAVSAGPRKHIVLVLDRAGWHASNDLVIPDGIHLDHRLRGALQGLGAERVAGLLRDPFSTCEVLAITEDVALAAAEVNRTLAAPLKAPDALIAAAAGAAGAVVITADEDLLRLPGLRVELLRPC